VNVPRPCPYVACRHNLYLDVDGHGNVNTAVGEPEEMLESCSLDMAERGQHELNQIAAALHVSSERVRQIERFVLYKIRQRPEIKRLL
jgi:hypothetical protein